MKIEVTFGKHRGSCVSDLPRSYLVWGASKLRSAKWRKVFNQELVSRKAERDSQPGKHQVGEKVQLNGRIVSCEIVKHKVPNYYGGPLSEEYAVGLNVGLEVEGDRYYFDTPTTSMTIASAPGLAVVTGKESDWVCFESGVAVPGKRNKLGQQAKVEVGQFIAIKGRVRKAYKRYTVLNYVKLIDVETQL